MSRSTICSTCVVLIGAVSYPAAAETQRKPRKPADSEPLMSHIDAGNEMSRLRNVGLALQNPKVQVDLGIGPRSQRAARGAALKISKDFLDGLQKLRVLNTNVAGNKVADGFRANVEKHLKAALTPKQIKRLHQIAVQRQGLSYFKSWDARMKLKFTNEQRAAIDKLVLKRMPQSAELGLQFQRKKLDRKSYFEKSKRLQVKNFQAALKILSPKQRKAYEKLAGEPFAW
jgi:hypothetical protein